MIQGIKVSTPSRLCLFGEHQDYLGLSVIAIAINLRFSAYITHRNDNIIRIDIRDESLDRLNDENSEKLYQTLEFNLEEPIVYKNNLDFFNSTLNVLIKNGYKLSGYDIKMDSQIPIGKGMCSSSTMIVVLIKAILEAIGHKDAKDPYKIAYLAYLAEICEFNNPGGMMDQYTSALGGLVFLDFEKETTAKVIDRTLGGRFILFDSLKRKDTINVLASSKIPTLEGLQILGEYGVNGISDFIDEKQDFAILNKLSDFQRKKILANIENRKILLEGLKLLTGSGPIDDRRLGELIYTHHKNLRDGLGISTPEIEKILDVAMANNAYGGKINGSGGGGCCFVYAAPEDCDNIIESIESLGFPGKILEQDTGVRVD